MNLTTQDAQAIIRECCEHSTRLIFTGHAMQRMRQRNIRVRQVVRCLCHGRVSEGPARSPKGDWKCTLEYIAAGTPIVVAVAIDMHAQPIVTVVITAYC